MPVSGRREIIVAFQWSIVSGCVAPFFKIQSRMARRQPDGALLFKRVRFNFKKPEMLIEADGFVLYPSSSPFRWSLALSIKRGRCTYPPSRRTDCVGAVFCIEPGCRGQRFGAIPARSSGGGHCRLTGQQFTVSPAFPMISCPKNSTFPLKWTSRSRCRRALRCGE